jgi:hypothetical protein
MLGKEALMPRHFSQVGPIEVRLVLLRTWFRRDRNQAIFWNAVLVIVAIAMFTHMLVQR